MRTDLEAAMGAVLTSRSAGDALAESAEAYASFFDLEPFEVEQLSRMAADLRALAPSFLKKRESGLTGHLRLTLELLGEVGEALVQDYVEEFAPLDLFADEALRFCSFVDRETVKMDDLPWRDVISNVARYERLKLRAFSYEAPLRPSPRTDATGLCLHPSVVSDAFEFDVRTVRSRADMPRCRPDSCVLLCYMLEEDGRVQTLRIDLATHVWLGTVRGHAEGGSADLASSPAGPSLRASLSKLARLGLLTGSTI